MKMLPEDPKIKIPLPKEISRVQPLKSRLPHLLLLLGNLKGVPRWDLQDLRREFGALAKSNMVNLPVFLRLFRLDGWALGPMAAAHYATIVNVLTQEGHFLWTPPKPQWSLEDRKAWTWFHQWLVMVWPESLVLPHIEDTVWRCLVRCEVATRYYRQPALKPQSIQEYSRGLTNVLLALDPESTMTRFDLYRAAHKQSTKGVQERSAWNYAPSGIRALQRMNVVGDIYGPMTEEEIREEYRALVKTGTVDEAGIMPPTLKHGPIKASTEHGIRLVSDWAESLQARHHSNSNQLLAMVQTTLNRLTGSGQPLTHTTVVKDIATNVGRPYTDNRKLKVGTEGARGNYFNVMDEFLAWCVQQGHIQENPLGYNPWAAHIRTYPTNQIEAIDNWYHNAREIIGDGHDGGWAMFREDIAIAVDKALRGHPKNPAGAVASFVNLTPTKALTGVNLQEMASFNAEWVASAARAFLLDPSGKNTSILYQAFPKVPINHPAVDVDALNISDDETPEGVLKMPMPLTKLEGHWNEDKETPQALSSDVDTRTGVNPVINPVNPINPVVNPVINPVNPVNHPTKEPESPVQVTTTPEDEVDALVGRVTVEGSWKEELVKLFPTAFNFAFAEALHNQILTATDLGKPPSTKQTGLGAFLRHCFGALNTAEGNVDLQVYTGSKQFRQLLNSSVKSSKNLGTLEPVAFADQMAEDHRYTPYNNETDRFLHLCYRLGSKW